MSLKEALSASGSVLEGTVLFAEPMSRHCSFRIGGPADVLIVPRNILDIKNVMLYARRNNIPVTVIGNGTDLLVSDKGIRGITLKINHTLDGVEIVGNTVSAEAGCPLARLARATASNSLSGLEFAAGIPGTVGGAIITNAGAHGQDIGQLVTRVIVMNRDGMIKELSAAELEFGNRVSNLQPERDIILKVELLLKHGDIQEMNQNMKQYLEWRAQKQPLNWPNAGSIFKKPDRAFAGALIEQCGFKGMQCGGAQVSVLHANFIINTGHATAEDVLTLMHRIQETVLNRYCIYLEPEIRIIGEY